MAVTGFVQLDPEYRVMALDLIRRLLPDATVWACGSRVKGTARASSDLDRVALGVGSDDPALYELREAFEESDLSFRVDLFSWEGVPAAFKTGIERGHVVFYAGHDHPRADDE